MQFDLRVSQFNEHAFTPITVAVTMALDEAAAAAAVASVAHGVSFVRLLQRGLSYDDSCLVDLSLFV